MLPTPPATAVAARASRGVRSADLLVLGDLGLDDIVRSVRGVLASAMLARAAGMRGIIVPDHCAAEAEVVDGIAILALRHLAESSAMLGDQQVLRAPSPGRSSAPRAAAVDMAEVRGQNLARAAVEVAVAGGHSVLLAGPPAQARRCWRAGSRPCSPR